MTFSLRSAMLAGAAVLAMAPAIATAQDETAKIEASADTVVAVVNGEEINVGHLIAARLALPEQYQALPNDVLLPGLVEQLIQQTVLGQAAGELSRRAEIQLENERRAIVATEQLETVIEEAITDEKIAEVYEAEYANAEPSEEWNASHILVETEDEAKALITELEGGADFAALAKEKSTGPSGPSGGALGWFSAGMMVMPFEEAVAKMDAGAISAPVQTQFGWHVIKLNETRMKGAPALEEVQGEIIQKLETDAVETAIKALMDAASIERTDLTGMDPAVIGNFSLLD